ncbi:MAG: 50S ribosomal protein L3 [Planctomycetes bacterium]|nr:50S ribosomal protein L3 [Planctomycetota bacterium]MBI3836006.1 50S ribosomal protein L3 [Planctomycetota bacterium]
MIPGILGTKVGMTRILGDHGLAEPVTVVQAGPCVVLQVKTKESDGYDALQLGFRDVKPHRSTKPMIGHAAKANTGPKRTVHEFRLSKPIEISAGDVITVARFAENDLKWVDVRGRTKGKGFAGVMKRHGFGGMPASHGTERKHRSPGGIGADAPRGTGQSVKKGKRMAGHMGAVFQTMSTLKLLKVDPANDLLVIRGSIPGPNGTVVEITPAKKAANKVVRKVAVVATDKKKK